MNLSQSGKKAQSVDAPELGELVDLVVTYAKQQTIDPIRGAGRWLAYGLVAVFSMTLGVLMLAIGTLRLLQFEVFADSTRWSWVPYFIVMILCALVVAVTLRRINKASLHLGGRS